jgi:phosphohistidine phosphatase
LASGPAVYCSGAVFFTCYADPSLYSASHLDIATFLRGIQGEPGSIMLFGHNPGMSEFITDCVPGFTENLPTGGVAVLQFEISSWNDLRSEAELRYFDFPKNQKN